MKFWLSSKEYVNNFNVVDSMLIENQKMVLKMETDQIKNTIKTMSESGLIFRKIKLLR